MKVIVIDDEKNICLTLQGILEDESYEVSCALNGKDGLSLVEDYEPDTILLDVKLQDANGIALLEQIHKADPTLPVIMISGNSSISDAVKAIKLGAFDFLEKPLSLPKVKITVKKALEFRQINEQVRQLQEQYEKEWSMVGSSHVMQELGSIISKVAPTTAKILIRGESGTGKELIARLIHNRSTRSQNAFIKFNSAAIPKELVESELFGYEKGAFTGAVKSKKGKLEQADMGTLFLDEIGDMDLEAQAKILRVMQEGEFERVGSNQTHYIDVRVIAATNKNLEELVHNGHFREDLFYRLNVVPVYSPPLRERSEDIPLLVEHFSMLCSGEMKVPKRSFNPDALNYLCQYSYPGNVRELKNLVERLYILCDKASFSREDIEAQLHYIPCETASSRDDFWLETSVYNDKKHDFEYRYLTTQLKLHNNNISRTAEALSMQQSNLSRKLHELGIIL